MADLLTHFTVRRGARTGGVNGLRYDVYASEALETALGRAPRQDDRTSLAATASGHTRNVAGRSGAIYAPDLTWGTYWVSVAYRGQMYWQQALAIADATSTGALLLDEADDINPLLLESGDSLLL